MKQWARAPEHREQMVLYGRRLDDAIPAGHPVRLLDELLGLCSWEAWEAKYHGRLGQPPIHPRILASVLLYGLLARLRSSRALEDALKVRLDFRWLASGQQIDHTTLSEFRRKNSEPLKQLFLQVCQVARNEKLLSLERLCFDGTRVRANNRRRGTRTLDELRQELRELEAKFADHDGQVDAQDSQDEESFGADDAQELPADLRDAEKRREILKNALARLEQTEAQGGKLPDRVPATDPDARIMPNKEGGFAPNYTPTTMVDAASGLVVGVDVLPVHNEDSQLIPALEQVRRDFDLPQLPPEILADGLMATAANVEACEERGITLFAPVPQPSGDNPALRDDPTQAVPESQWDQLPTYKHDGQRKIDKSAFVYDAEKDCYWCPLGQRMPHRHTTSERNGGQRRIRDRYIAAPQACAACPLRERCLNGKNEARQINRERGEAARERHAKHMATSEAQHIYEQRRHPGERPFAVIKQVFGVRQFLLRGLGAVSDEWRWAALAFNLDRLMSLRRSRAGPATVT